MRPNWGNDRRRYEGGAWLPFNWSSIPVTRALLFTTVGVFLAFFFTGQTQGPVWEWLTFRTIGNAWLFRPWTWLTYGFVEIPRGGDFGWVWVLLDLYILYQMGGMLERAWGSINLAVLYFAFSAVGCLTFIIPYYLLGKGVLLNGLHVELTALIVAWAAMDPDQDVNYWGVPVKARFLGLLWVALEYFSFGIGTNDPILALFLLGAPAASFLYVRKLPRLNLDVGVFRGRAVHSPSRSQSPPRPRDLLREDPPAREKVSGFNPLRRRQEQEEIERLKRLLGDDDDSRETRRR